MEGCDQDNVRWWSMRDEFLEGTRGSHARDPGGIGLFGGLDDSGFPSGAFGFGLGGIGAAHAMVRHDWDQGRHAEFGGLLKDPVHGLWFGDGLNQSDGMRGLGDGFLGDSAEGDATFLNRVDLGMDAQSVTIEDDDLLAKLESEHGCGVMSVGISEIEDLAAAAIRWEKKPVHGGGGRLWAPG